MTTKKSDGRSIHVELDIEIPELIEALNDRSKAEELMKARGWKREDLVKRAEVLSNAIAARAKSVSVV